MRVTPTATYNDIQVADSVSTAINVTSIGMSTNISSDKFAWVYFYVTSGVVQYRPYYIRISDNVNGYLDFDAEL